MSVTDQPGEHTTIFLSIPASGRGPHDFTRECLALVVDPSLSGIRVAPALDAIIIARAKLMIVSDNGT